MIDYLAQRSPARRWLGETLAAVQLLGGGIVLIGIVLAQTSR